MHFDYCIIGGGVAGTTAAETIRSFDMHGSIGIISSEPFPLYSRVLLANYVKGTVASQKIFLRSKEWYAKKNITLITGETVEIINSATELVTHAGTTISFGKLLIASGVTPRTWDVAEGRAGVYTLWSLRDAQNIQKELETVRTAVVVGSGFIGLEFAELLASRNISVTIVARNAWYWHRNLRKEEAALIHAVLAKRNITLITNDDVQSVQGHERVESVTTRQGKIIPCDFVGLGIGTAPNADFVQGIVRMGERGVATDEYLRTSKQNIFAAGDVAEFYDPVLEVTHRLGSWANAVHQGQVAGTNMAGGSRTVSQVSTYTFHVFPEIAIVFVGIVGHPSAQEILRYDVAKQSYGRLLMKGNRIIGGVFMNRSQDVAPVMKLIETKKEVANLGGLSNIDFDLRQLL